MFNTCDPEVYFQDWQQRANLLLVTPVGCQVHMFHEQSAGLSSHSLTLGLALVSPSCMLQEAHWRKAGFSIAPVPGRKPSLPLLPMIVELLFC